MPLEKLLNACPHAPDFTWNWPLILDTPVGAVLRKLDDVPQSPVWHGEGSAGTHTRWVCEELAKDADFRALPLRKQQELSVTALLHDIGKIPCTRLEDGQWVSPNHSSVGAKMARELLWTAFSLCGTAEKQTFRETVCLMIRHHMLPGHILDQNNPEKRLLTIAADGELCPDFTLDMLCSLAKADIRGRIAPDIGELMEKIVLFRQEAELCGCLHGPGTFADAYTRRAYFKGRSVWREQQLFNDTWGEVILLSGLPGTGKDTWIQANCPHLPMVSLDALRLSMGVSPTEEQGRVAQAAKEQARQYLRTHQPFVWNATNVTDTMRAGLIQLFEGYRASVRVIYLETEWQENLRRNFNRKHAVPEHAVCAMLARLTPPQRPDAQQVEWRCV